MLDRSRFRSALTLLFSLYAARVEFDHAGVSSKARFCFLSSRIRFVRARFVDRLAAVQYRRIRREWEVSVALETFERLAKHQKREGTKGTRSQMEIRKVRLHASARSVRKLGLSETINSTGRRERTPSTRIATLKNRNFAVPVPSRVTCCMTALTFTKYASSRLRAHSVNGKGNSRDLRGARKMRVVWIAI